MEDLTNGLYGDNLQRVHDINTYYDIYEGKQEWDIPDDLDYTPTQKITNYIKKLIDTKARFMFGREPFFDVVQVKEDSRNNTKYEDIAQAKEELLMKILDDNKFHSKLMKGEKDRRIGGSVAIKLWGHKEEGIRITFSPAQEFFVVYDDDDIDTINKIHFMYLLNEEPSKDDQRVLKQTWEMEEGKCILKESIYNGDGEEVEVIIETHDTGLDFIPIIIVRNGGLTGDTEGVSDVEILWQDQDMYNKLTSDDIDALKFNMFPQKVITDASEDSIKNIVIAPGAIVDLETDGVQADKGIQARMDNLESNFSYADKFETTLNRHKNNMFELMNVPNIGIDQLQGVMTSGKAMQALYWDLMIACDEDLAEWVPALRQMVEYIFSMIEEYDCYESGNLASEETGLEIITEYPVQDDINEQKKIDMEEVNMEVRSRKSYINKWSEAQDKNVEFVEIIQELSELDGDDFTSNLIEQIEEGE